MLGTTITKRHLGAIAALLFILSTAPPAQAQGAAAAWGWDDYAQVSGTPVGKFTSAAAGFYSSVGIREDGTLTTWTDTSFGRTGYDFEPPSGTFTAVSASFAMDLAIRTDGTLAGWGYDAYGLVSSIPSGTFTAISAGGDHCVAIRPDGTLVSWGYDIAGETSGTPGGTYIAVAAGFYHTVAIRTDGTLVAWGDDTFHQVSDTPQGTFVAVAACVSHNVALRTDGTLVSWGNDVKGQVLLTPPGRFTAVAAGAYHCVAIRQDGTLISWGDDAYGQVSGTPAGHYSAVACGWYHNVALQQAGDRTPPTTTASVTPPPNAFGWNNSGVMLTLAAQDDPGGSGLASTFWAIVPGGQVQTYLSPLGISGDGTVSYSYWSVDNANNIESAHSLTVNIDTVAPGVVAGAKPAHITSQGRGSLVSVTVSGSITDSLSGIDQSSGTYSVTDSYGTVQPSGNFNFGPSGAYSFTTSLEAYATGTPPRQYRITVRGRDRAGNQGSVQCAFTVQR